ncbi:unnamed protein product [Rotaria magnacalcarata]
MPRKIDFCSKWLLKVDNTDRVCSRWLTKGKTSNSFRCIVCNTDDLSCGNGGWYDLKKHFDLPKHIQCMKDVFGSIPLVVSPHPSASLSSNTNDDSVCTTASSTSVNQTRISFVNIYNDQRSLTRVKSHVLNVCGQWLHLNLAFHTIHHNFYLKYFDLCFLVVKSQLIILCVHEKCPMLFHMEQFII